MRLILSLLSLVFSFSVFAIPECPGPRCPKSYMCFDAARARQYGVTCTPAEVAASRAAAARPVVVVDRRTPRECPGRDCPKSYMCIMPQEARRYGVVCSQADIDAARLSTERSSSRRSGRDNSTTRRNPKADLPSGTPTRSGASTATGDW